MTDNTPKEQAVSLDQKLNYLKLSFMAGHYENLATQATRNQWAIALR